MSELSLTRAGTRWGKRKLWWIQMKDKLFLHTSCPPCASFLVAVSHTGSDSLVTPGHYKLSSTYFVVCVDLDLWFKFFLKSWRKHPLPPFQQRITHTGLVGVFPHRFPCISLNILKPPSSLQEFPLITCIFCFSGFLYLQLCGFSRVLPLINKKMAQNAFASHATNDESGLFSTRGHISGNAIR